MEFIHGRLAVTAVLFPLALGVWAGWDFVRGNGISPSYWGAVLIGELVMIAQGIIGATLVLTGQAPGNPIHFLYGMLVAVAYPAVYVYTHGRNERRDLMWYVIVSFFVFFAALRAQGTGT